MFIERKQEISGAGVWPEYLQYSEKTVGKMVSELTTVSFIQVAMQGDSVDRHKFIEAQTDH